MIGALRRALDQNISDLQTDEQSYTHISVVQKEVEWLDIYFHCFFRCLLYSYIELNTPCNNML